VLSEADEPSDEVERDFYGVVDDQVGKTISEVVEFVEQGYAALLRKSAEGRSTPSAGQTYSARCVIGVPRAVKRFRIAALT
jgi:hypothetical protein